jgi:hypothetical protein
MSAHPRTDTRLFICAPLPLAELRTTPDSKLQLGLVESFCVSVEGPERGVVTITRKWERQADSLLFPSGKFFGLLREGLNIPPGHGFNILYETHKPSEDLWGVHSWVPSHGLYLEGCDDSTATRSWMVNLTGEYEVTTLSFHKCRELAPEDIAARP